MKEDTQDITTRHASILIVDDTPINLSVMPEMLTARGYKVRQIQRGKETLATAQATAPDLILLDVNMPDMNGYEVCEDLKADAATRDIPVIFISALSESANILRGFEVGGVDYITKPFRFREVIARVENQLLLVRQREHIEFLRAQDRQYFESLNRVKDKFIRMATHDLRNPLNVILGYSHLLASLKIAEEEQEQLQLVVKNIRDNVEKMRQLVTDILDLAQIETRSHLSLNPVALAPFLAKCLESFQVIAAQKNIKIVYTPPPDDLMVNIDEIYMTRAIDNLISNAIKYIPDAGQITITAQPTGDTTIINIKDTGLGIPEADLPYLFNAFYRVRHKNHEDIEGSGLGLSIVKTIIEQHKGSIQVTSTLGQGSTFSIVLPAIATP